MYSLCVVIEVFMIPACVGDADITLRDANIASAIVRECFPVAGAELQYRGSIVFATRDGFDSTGNGVWTLQYVIPGDHSYAIRFDIVQERQSANDIAVHVSLERVVYFHIRSCWRNDIGWIQPEHFDENGIALIELFTHCDEQALRYWRFQARFSNALRISD